MAEPETTSQEEDGEEEPLVSETDSVHVQARSHTHTHTQNVVYADRFHCSYLPVL